MKKRSRGTGGIEQLPSGKWRVRWYTRTGRHPSRTFTIKRDAERFLREAIVDLEREGIDVSPQQATLATLIPPWWATVERSVKPRTAERYKLHRQLIERRLGDVRLRDLDYDTVQTFVDELASEYAPRTVGHCYAVLNLIMKDAQRRGKIIRAIPKPIMPRVQRPRLTIPAREDVERLALASDARLHAAVELAGYAGMRQGEVLAVHRGDVNLDEGWVFVHQSRNKTTGDLESTKTDAARRVYLPAKLRDTLTIHLAEYPAELLFPYTASVFQKSWNRARAATDLRAVRFHDLRHAAASMMIEAGWSVMQVSRQLGHSDPAMTLRTYAHLWPHSYDDAIKKMDAYLDHDSSSTA